MKHVFIIGKCPEVTESLSRYFRYHLHVETRSILVATGTATSGSNWVPHTFEQLADWIETAVAETGGARELLNAVAIVDLCDEQSSLLSLDEIDALAKTQRWAAVVGMLVLAFPEIHWAFITPYKAPEKVDEHKRTFYEEAHVIRTSDHLREVVQLNKNHFCPLFDPTGLRNHIRKSIIKAEKDCEYIPLRESSAAAIDEEAAYAYFNAYTAYRFGYQSHVVTTFQMMDRLFYDANCSTEKISLVFEDIYLKFADADVDVLSHRLQKEATQEVHLSDLHQRDIFFPRLRDADCRVFLTVGHKKSGDRKRDLKNDHYIRSLERARRGTQIYKPFSGIFDLLRSSRLKKWDDTHPAGHKPQSASSGHSAPGRLLEIADRLIHRAESMLPNIKSVPEAIHGALLTLEAKELLGHRTPTTSLEALSVQHQFEVWAECMFYGVERNFDVKSRLQEIESEVARAGEWFSPKTRKLSELNAQMGIVGKLVVIFRQNCQFDEEQQCMHMVRKLDRQITVRAKSWAWLFYPLRIYIEYLLVSPARFALAVVFWLALIAMLFSVSGGGSSAMNTAPVPPPLFTALHAFFGGEPPGSFPRNLPWWQLLATALAVVGGFVHLGIFISHVYSVISRK